MSESTKSPDNSDVTSDQRDNKSPVPSSRQQTPSSLLLCLREVQGELRLHERSYEMRWTVNIGLNGAIDFEFAPVAATNEAFWLFEVGLAKGPFLTRLSARGTTPDGTTVESDHVYIVECGSTSDATSSTITIRGDATRLRIIHGDLPKEADGLTVVYNTVGMRAFGTPTAMTSAGKLTLSGPSKIVDPEP